MTTAPLALKFLDKFLDTHKSSVPLGGLSACAALLISQTLDLLFPQRSTRCLQNETEVNQVVASIRKELDGCLLVLEQASLSVAEGVSERFVEALPPIRSLLLLDAEAIHRGDPAAKSTDEVIITYPGFFAIAVYRIAHALLQNGVPLLPRVLTEYAHRETGIDIHPGAQIGESFCIDHGTGIVIGETTVIKDNVRMYQGVTLGGLVITKGHANQKRHPTIESNVVIYANATILGGETVVGAGSVIGGNVWLTVSVEPNSLVYHKGDITIRQTSKNPE